MQKPPLEKVIEKLEKLDIREWRCEEVRYNNCLITKVSGLVVNLYKEYGTIPAQYFLKIINEGAKEELSYGQKKEKESVKKIYEKTYELYTKYKKEEFQEKLNHFLSD